MIFLTLPTPALARLDGIGNLVCGIALSRDVAPLSLDLHLPASPLAKDLTALKVEIAECLAQTDRQFEVGVDWTTTSTGVLRLTISPAAPNAPLPPHGGD